MIIRCLNWTIYLELQKYMCYPYSTKLLEKQLNKHMQIIVPAFFVTYFVFQYVIGVKQQAPSRYPLYQIIN